MSCGCAHRQMPVGLTFLSGARASTTCLAYRYRSVHYVLSHYEYDLLQLQFHARVSKSIITAVGGDIWTWDAVERLGGWIRKVSIYFPPIV